MDPLQRLERFVSWLAHFDACELQNEDDVETKFVLPFFAHLGYPDPCRRGKYPLALYNPGKSGRKPEVDQAYFSSSVADEQNGDTCLMVVEAKEPNEVDLSRDLEQARFYGYFLTPVFLVLTNGHRLVALKRRHFQSEERLFDDSIESLKEPRTAEKLYELLNYEIAKAAKRDSLDQLAYPRYVKLEASLRRYPSLVEILNQGDFQPFRYSEADTAMCVQPKVAVLARLPVALSAGSVEVEFSSITRRGLRIRIDHSRVLRDLFIGLATPLSLGARRFLRVVAGGYEVRLGDTETVLEASEAQELCKCVDYVCSQYRRVLDETDTALKAYCFQPTLDEDGRSWSFPFLRVDRHLWTLLKTFADDHDYSTGNGAWNVSNAHHLTDLRVYRPSEIEHAHVTPRLTADTVAPTSQDSVECMYAIQPWTLDSIERSTGLSWTKSVGPAGLWSIPAAEKWMIEQLIPTVRKAYTPERIWPSYDPYYDGEIERTRTPDLTGDAVTSAKSFIPYLEHIEYWVSGRMAPLPAKLLRPFYRSFFALAKKIRQPLPDTGSIGYLMGKFGGMGSETGNRYAAAGERAEPLDRLLSLLDWNTARIHHTKYEDTVRAASIVGGLYVFLGRFQVDASQADLTAATEALLPLWTECRFERRYVFP